MIEEVTIRGFKGIREITIPLGDSVVFAGPNNSCKTTALQALTIWDFANKKWLEKKGDVSVTRKRPGVTVSRLELVTPPVPELNLLW